MGDCVSAWVCKCGYSGPCRQGLVLYKSYYYDDDDDNDHDDHDDDDELPINSQHFTSAFTPSS